MTNRGLVEQKSNSSKQGNKKIPATDPCSSPADIRQDPIGDCTAVLFTEARQAPTNLLQLTSQLNDRGLQNYDPQERTSESGCLQNFPRVRCIRAGALKELSGMQRDRFRWDCDHMALEPA